MDSSAIERKRKNSCLNSKEDGDDESSSDNNNGEDLSQEDENDKDSSDDSGSEEETLKKKKVPILKLRSYKLQSDIYPNQEWDDGISNLIPVHPVTRKEPFFRLATSREYYEDQVCKNIYYEVKFEDGSTMTMGPWLNKEGKCILNIGDEVLTVDIRKKFGIREPKSKEFASECWATTADRINGILCELDFKNDIVSVQNILEKKIAEDMFVGLKGGG